MAGVDGGFGVSNWLLNAVVTVLAAGGGGALIAYAIFRFLAVSWLETKFAEKMERQRHLNAKELATFRSEIDKDLQHTIRMQERTQQILSDAWTLANDACGRVAHFVSPSKEYNDINKMPERLRVEFIGSLDFLEAQKSEILESADPFEKYRETLFLKASGLANEARIKFHNFLVDKKIFMEPKYWLKFNELSEILAGSIHERESYGFEYRTLEDKSWENIQTKAYPLLDTIADEVQAEIFNRLPST